MSHDFKQEFQELRNVDAHCQNCIHCMKMPRAKGFIKQDYKCTNPKSPHHKKNVHRFNVCDLFTRLNQNKDE